MDFEKMQNDIGWGKYNEEMVEEYLSDLRTWLLERVYCEDGGWPEVSKEDWGKVWQFIIMMMDLKFELDCDRDQVIKVFITDRSKASQVALSIPHEGKLSEMARNIEMLNSYANYYSKILSFKLKDKEDSDETQKSNAA